VVLRPEVLLDLGSQPWPIWFLDPGASEASIYALANHGPLRLGEYATNRSWRRRHREPGQRIERKACRERRGCVLLPPDLALRMPTSLAVASLSDRSAGHVRLTGTPVCSAPANAPPTGSAVAAINSALGRW